MKCFYIIKVITVQLMAVKRLFRILLKAESGNVFAPTSSTTLKSNQKCLSAENGTRHIKKMQ